VGPWALEKIELLNEVVLFKMKFYHCAWAKYDEAKPGTLRLVPLERHIDELQGDYRSMQAMLFGQIPSFEDIIRTVSQLEKSINELT